MSARFLGCLLIWGITGLVTCYAQECGRPPLTENRIVGGVDASDGAWPWQVDVQMDNKHACGGSIITKDWVLSAAHCFPNPNNVGRYLIYAGRHQLHGINLHESVHRVSQVVMPYSYTEPHSGNDVALVKLSTPVEWSDHIRPVCLPSSETLFTAGMVCYVTGWGDIREDVSLPGLGTLQEVSVPIISQSSCQQMYQTDPIEQVDILSDMICAGYQEGGKDSCQGDSGGPLVCQMINSTWVQAGVVSFGLGCANRNKPGVYARLTTFADFIKRTVPEVQLYGGAEQTWSIRTALWVTCVSTLQIWLQR